MKDKDRLIAFIYLLIRDEVSFGNLYKIIEHNLPIEAEKFIYSSKNGYALAEEIYDAIVSLE